VDLLGVECLACGADPDAFAEIIRVERDFYRAARKAAGIEIE